MKLNIYNSYHVVACPMVFFLALLLIEIEIIINCIINNSYIFITYNNIFYFFIGLDLGHMTRENRSEYGPTRPISEIYMRF